MSPAISVPDNLDRGGLEQCRLQVEQLLNRLTLEAEAWAESGTRKLEEVPLRREPIWKNNLRIDQAHPPKEFRVQKTQMKRMNADEHG